MNIDQNIRTQSPLRLGFIGGSLRSAVGYAHFVSCKMDRKWELSAGCFSQNAEVNQETSHAYGVASDRLYDNWRDMLKREQGYLDAILVLTPTPTHSEIVTACLEHGYPVICEKALATNSAEAEQILTARNRYNGFLAVTYNYSGYPMVRELRNKIREGALGKILHFQAEMPQEGFIRTDARGNKPSPQAWRLADGEVPTIHLDLAVHLHHLLHYLTGARPIDVISNHGSYGWFPQIVDNVSCLCNYSGDMQGQLWFSKSSLGHRNGLRLRIYGSKASAEWYQAEPEQLTISHSDGRRETIDRSAAVAIAGQPRYTRFKAGHPAGFIEAFANLYADIADCLHNYRTTGVARSDDVFSAELALEGLDFLQAMTTSVQTRTWQTVPSR